MSSKKDQFGFIPVVYLIVAIIILGGGFVYLRQNNLFPTPLKTLNSTSSTLPDITPRPIFTPGGSKTQSDNSTNTSSVTPTPTKTAATSTNTPTPTSTQNSNPTNTPTPTNSPTSAPTSTPTPAGAYVKVSSPNGGESYHQGDPVNITWSSNVLGSCTLQTVDSNNSGIAIASNISASQGSYSWSANMGNTSQTSRQFKIYMICYDANSGAVNDYSDDYFTISQ